MSTRDPFENRYVTPLATEMMKNFMMREEGFKRFGLVTDEELSRRERPPPEFFDDFENDRSTYPNDYLEEGEVPEPSGVFSIPPF